ncbi:Uncharacterized protein SCF082_LOCUS44267 [Durusdinium trenchii]|uniref:Uncharacterized protein n=1 Tax=Durusdinium trenchii TaxID=1381693 RepID=A0ABP0R1R6_9DINO
MASPALRRGLRFVLAVALAVAPLQRLSTFVAPATVSAPTARRVALIAVGLGVESFAAPAWGSGACDASDVEKYQMLTYVKMMVSIRKLKPQWDEEMKKFLFEDPPGGTWEDRCIRRFGSSQYPKDEGQKCMAKRVSEGTGLSAGCGLCWGKLAQCTYDNCASLCLDAKSQKCQQCISEKCATNFEQCSGIKL